MDTKVIPLSDLQADPEGVLSRCFDSGEPLVVALPSQVGCVEFHEDAPSSEARP
jgi:hypothetical protein